MAEPMYTQLKCEVQHGVLVLTITQPQVEGDDTAEALRDEMLRAVTSTGLRKVVVDFRNTKYISSVAFRPLLSLRKKLQELNGRLLLCGLTQVVGEVFYTTRMATTAGSSSAPFEIEADAAAAVAHLAGTGKESQGSS
jgi:anti-anti-sigma factor